MPARPHLQIYGYPHLRDASGQPVGLRTRKQLALLVYLALEARDRPVSRDVLVDLFWSDVPAARGRHSLSQALTAIRQALGRDAVAGGAGAVRLTADLATDLDGAVNGDAGAGGPDLAAPLRELESAGGPAFAHWVDASRERCLRLARAGVLEQLQEARAAGAMARVHERAAVLYRVDPFSDAAVHALAEGLLLHGDTPGAIRLLRRHVERARRALGCNPHPDVERLLKRVEDGRVPAPFPEAAMQRAHPRRREVFVGREVELARLESEWTEARGGRVRTFLVGGPAGIGKSSLIRRFATSVAARAWPVFTVACQEIGSGIPFAAISELITGMARDPAVSGTEPAWLAEASRVTPGLRVTYPGIPEPPPVPAEAVRVRVAEALVRMLGAIAEDGPVAIVVDDVQHLDPASRDILHVFLRRVEEGPVLLVAAARSEGHGRIGGDGEDGPALSWHGTLELAPLDAERALELIGGLSEAFEEFTDALRKAIAELAQGNPYLIEMLLADWEANPTESLVAAEAAGDGTGASWRPPDTMRRAFARHYRGLSPTTQHILNLLAVAGRAMTVEEIAAALSLEVAPLVHATFDLVDRGILRSAGVGLGFKNELHRAFVYYAMPQGSRLHYHGSLASSLLRYPQPGEFQAKIEASHHFLRAGQKRGALDAALEGAQLALLSGAPREAERALAAVSSIGDPSDQPKIRLSLGRAAAAQGDYQRALATIQDLDMEIGALTDRSQAAVLTAEAFHRGRLADEETVARAARSALELAREVGDANSLARAIQIRAEVACDFGNLVSLRQAQRMANALRSSTSDLLARRHAELTNAFCLYVLGEFSSALQCFKDLTRERQRATLDPERLRVLNGLAVCFLSMGQYHESRSTLEEAVRVALEVGEVDMLATMWLNIGTAHEDLGNFEASATAYRTSFNWAMSARNPRRITAVLVNAAGLAISIGRLDESANLLRQAEQYSEEAQLWGMKFSVLLAEADLALARSETEECLALIEAAEAVRGKRTDTVTNGGRYQRLLKYRLWKTRGYDAIAQRLRITDPNAAVLRHAARLEASYIDEWITEGGSDIGELAALKPILDDGLFGILTYLTALGFAPKRLRNRAVIASPAQVVRATYGHDAECFCVPTSVLGADEWALLGSGRS